MHRNLDTPKAQAAADTAQPVAASAAGPASSAGAELAEGTEIRHDTTIKWIVEDAGGEKPSPPVAATEEPKPTTAQTDQGPGTDMEPQLHPISVAASGDFVTPDSTAVPRPSDPIPADAASISVHPGQDGSNGNLPEVAIDESSSSEPHEVDMEVLVETDSGEPLFTQLSSQAPDQPRTTTPPPIPAEAAFQVRPPTPPEAPAKGGNHKTDPGPPAGAQPPPPKTDLAAGWFEDPAGTFLDGEPLPEALARRPLQKRSKPWYEEVFDEDYLRTLPFMTAEQTEREVRFIREALSPPVGGEILDIACGYGRHALELAQQGLRMTGLDLSLPMLIRAADHAQKRGLSVNFVHADMREMSFSGQFDAAYCVLSSFGYFDEETNLRVVSSICKALKPGGRFLLDIINRDYIVGDLPSRVWWEGDGCVVLEEVDFNYHTSRVLIRRSIAFGNGRQVEQDLSVRAYSLHELGKLLRNAGLRVLDISGGLATKSRFFGASSRNIIAVCERAA